VAVTSKDRAPIPSWQVGRSIHDDDFYAPTRFPNLFLYQQRSRQLVRLLTCNGMLPLHEKRMLDIGCGGGDQLVEFEGWGARRHNLAGIDLNETRVSRARARLTYPGAMQDRGADIRCGDAAHLPWPDEVFDVVSQSVVFTSIPVPEVKEAVAAEMLRVLKPGGAVIWYDFLYDNPSNQTVKGIGAREIRSLFAGCEVTLQRVTLAPPLARRLVPISWMAAMVCEGLVLANTHYLGLIRKPAMGMRPGSP
jgi:SAM-dependent methyltransferase